jgi:hypothetical protein
MYRGTERQGPVLLSPPDRPQGQQRSPGVCILQLALSCTDAALELTQVRVQLAGSETGFSLRQEQLARLGISGWLRQAALASRGPAWGAGAAQQGPMVPPPTSSG